MRSLIDEIYSFIHCVEGYHSSKTRDHEFRTGKLMSLLGIAYGLERSICTIIEEVGALHDIGKILISEVILDKPGTLTISERKIVERHPVIGFNLVKGIKHPDIDVARKIILTHHENYDGTGYPNGLSGDAIPFEGRLCSICDVYDALRTNRPYRQKKTHKAVVKMMYDSTNLGLYHKFCPKLMEAFKSILHNTEELYDS